MLPFVFSSAFIGLVDRSPIDDCLPIVKRFNGNFMNVTIEPEKDGRCGL
jgi:hypothetical protein